MVNLVPIAFLSYLCSYHGLDEISTDICIFKGNYGPSNRTYKQNETSIVEVVSYI